MKKKNAYSQKSYFEEAPVQAGNALAETITTVKKKLPKAKKVKPVKAKKPGSITKDISKIAPTYGKNKVKPNVMSAPSPLSMADMMKKK